jgi:hypothetical protein
VSAGARQSANQLFLPITDVLARVVPSAFRQDLQFMNRLMTAMAETTITQIQAEPEAEERLIGLATEAMCRACMDSNHEPSTSKKE